MSNGDDESEETEAPGEDAAESEGAPDAETLESRLDETEEAIETAETESDLDELEATLDGIESDVEAADLPEPEDEEEESRREQLESRLGEVRDALEEARGPYAEDVTADIESARETLTTAEWTEDGEDEAAAAVKSFLETVEEILGTALPVAEDSIENLDSTLGDAAEGVEDAALDPDEDEETIADLLEATDALMTGLDDAEEWEDLTVREQLQAEGFYDRLTPENRKDFPPELTAIRVAEQENDPERLLQALDYFESNFMEENVLDALRRLGPVEAVEPMLERAEKRDQAAIRVLGKIGDERAIDTLVEFIQDESNPPLQKVTLRALGEIGSDEATQDVADRLVAEDPEVRSHAASALGRIGDTRAIDPLVDVLSADEDDSVRAAAAWALNQIGTERALDAAAEYTDDRAYIVQAEAEKARDATAA